MFDAMYLNRRATRSTERSFSNIETPPQQAMHSHRHLDERSQRCVGLHSTPISQTSDDNPPGGAAARMFARRAQRLSFAARAATLADGRAPYRSVSSIAISLSNATFTTPPPWMLS